MATRARIGIENPDGTITSIYTHSDGYPEHHAPILTKHYADTETVRVLLDLGDLSMLAEGIGELHAFESGYREHPNWCLAYGRDRCETGVDAETHPGNAWPDSGQEYEYLFSAGAWIVRDVYEARGRERWVELPRCA